MSNDKAQMPNSPCVIALWASRRAGITQGKCQSPKPQPWYQFDSPLVARPSLLVRHLLNFNRFSTLCSLDWWFGHLSIWIWFVIWIFSFEIMWQNTGNSRKNRRPLTTPTGRGFQRRNRSLSTNGGHKKSAIAESWFARIIDKLVRLKQ